jgi:hypothetical protein
MHITRGFVVDSSRRILSMGNSAVHITYSSGHDVDDNADRLRRRYDSALDVDHRLFYYAKDFDLDGCSAEIYYSKSDIPGRDRLALFLRSNTFSTAAIGTFPENDKAARDTVLTMLLSMRPQAQTPPDIAGLVSFTADFSRSEFAYCDHEGSVFLYTIDGQDDPFIDRDQVMILQIPPGHAVPLQERILHLLKAYSSTSFHITDTTFRNTYVRAEPACECEGNLHYNGKPGKVYVMALGGLEHQILLSALLHHNVQQRLGEVLYIAHSLEFKAMSIR